jgi:hypothetical protein
VRRERPFYRDNGDRTASTTTGFRLVLSGPLKSQRRTADGGAAAGDPEFDKELDNSWRLLSEASGAGSEDRQSADAKLADLQGRLQQTRAEAQRAAQQLAASQAEYARQNALRAQQEKQALADAEAKGRVEQAQQLAVLKTALELSNVSSSDVARRLQEAQAANARIADALRAQQAAVAEAGARARGDADLQLASMDAALRQRLGDLEQANEEVRGIQAELVRSNTAINTRDRRIRRQLVEGQIGLALNYNNTWRRIEAAPDRQAALREQLRAGRMDGAALTPAQRERISDALNVADQNIARLRRTNQLNFQRYVQGMSQLAREPRPDMIDAVNAIAADDSRRYDIDYQRAAQAVKRHLFYAQETNGIIDTKRQTEWRLDLERRLIDN